MYMSCTQLRYINSHAMMSYDSLRTMEVFFVVWSSKTHERGCPCLSTRGCLVASEASYPKVPHKIAQSVPHRTKSSFLTIHKTWIDWKCQRWESAVQWQSLSFASVSRGVPCPEKCARADLCSLLRSLLRTLQIQEPLPAESPADSEHSSLV